MMTHSSVDVGSTANVPAFLTKLWKLVEDPNYDHLIHWSQNGKSFIISNQAQFAKELLPLYFKHNNMASFIRQLNMYGFRKLTNIENSGLRAERDDIEFYHLHFVKDQEASLELIKRKIKTPLQVTPVTKSIDEAEVRQDDVGSILVDVKAIKGKQDTVDNILVNIQKENEALWREIAILRRKYQKQQHIVEKLLQFLLSLVRQRGIGVKRKSPLMIGLDDSGDSDGDMVKPQKTAKSDDDDVNDDQTFNALNEYGPTIFDVSDDIIEAELEATANNCPIIATAELSPLTNHTSDSPVADILDSNLLDTDTVEALFNPIQSVIGSSLLTPDNLINTNIDTKVQPTVNTESTFNDSSLLTSNNILNTNITAVQTVNPLSDTSTIIDSSLLTPNNLMNTDDIDNVQSVNTGSTLIDPSSVSTINIDGRTIDQFLGPGVFGDCMDNFDIVLNE